MNDLRLHHTSEPSLGEILGWFDEAGIDVAEARTAACSTCGLPSAA